MKLLTLLDRFFEKTTTYMLIVAIFSMLFLSVMTIVLRWFGVTFFWLEPLVRHLVFATIFLGGIMATGRASHICIDVVGTLLDAKGYVKFRHNVKRLILLVSTLTIVWLIKGSITFVGTEFEFGKIVFWGIHGGYLVSIIPAGFSVIAYRFFYRFVKSLTESAEPEAKSC